jgi:hypothetical protein
LASSSHLCRPRFQPRQKPRRTKWALAPEVALTACDPKRGGDGFVGVAEQVLIHGGAIKNPRKPFYYSNLKIPNRR